MDIILHLIYVLFVKLHAKLAMEQIMIIAKHVKLEDI